MRSTVLILLCALIVTFTTGIASSAEGPVDLSKPPIIDAQSAILIDSVTGKVLYEKNSRKRMPPASTTKIMTTILALEHGDLNDMVCASENASETPFGGLHLKPGETLTLNDLLYGMLLRSSNDAAVCASEHIGGTEAHFADMMNEKAKELGAKDTHFVNPHGLYDPDHYSTAYDLALIARYAIRKPVFNEIVKTQHYNLKRSINDKDVVVRNTARFLWKYKGADGIKTGYTKEAGRCFVGSATRDNWRLISVVLHATDAGADTAKIMDYGFHNFKEALFVRDQQPVKTVQVRGGVKKQVDLVAAKDLAIVLAKSAPAETRTEIKIKRVSAPIEKGKKFGTLTGYLNGKEIGTVDLVASETIQRTLLATILYVLKILLMTILGLMVVFIAYGTTIAKSSRRRRSGLTSRSRETYYKRTGSRKW